MSSTSTPLPTLDSPVDAEHGAQNVRKVVHDLRNVIAPLRNATQLIRMRSRNDSALAPIAEILERQINEMVRMLNELSAANGATPAGAAHANAQPENAPANAQRRVLIVDDNVALLTSLSSVLREAGHGVKTAEDGRQALTLAASWHPDFVLLDAAMPQMNGFEVARQLRATYARDSMKLVLMSGSTLDEATRRGAERAGFDYCIDKIHSFATLESVLRGCG
jgi:CheY-like chemotaxis protein